MALSVNGEIAWTNDGTYPWVYYKRGGTQRGLQFVYDAGTTSKPDGELAIVFTTGPPPFYPCYELSIAFNGHIWLNTPWYYYDKPAAAILHELLIYVPDDLPYLGIGDSGGGAFYPELFWA